MRKYRICAAALLMAVMLGGCDGADRTRPVETTAPTEPSVMTEAPTEEPTTENLTVDEGATPLASFAYEIKDGYAVITDFVGKETEVVVPSRIGDTPVTQIGQYAFEASWDVQSVVIPESVTFIGEQAFADCESLTSVNIPSGVTALYRATFASCLSLETLTIPTNVTETDEELLVACPLTDLYVENPALEYASWGLEEQEIPCTIHAPEGAVILTWAEANGFPTETMAAPEPSEIEETSAEEEA